MQTAHLEQIPLKSLHIPPSDAERADIFSSTEFASWFKLRTVATNGVVDPADSLNFRGTRNFSYYKWAKQMFLWLIPRPQTAGGPLNRQPSTRSRSRP